MRKAAGILMIIYGAKTIGFFTNSLINNWSVNRLELVAVIWAAFIITCGVFCLKRKYWRVCFASSLALLIWVVYDLGSLGLGMHIIQAFKFIGLEPRIWLNTLLTVPLGVLPEIFVCLRKSEWQEVSA